MLGGFISIGSITSTATATSDGTTGKVTGSTQVQNVSIAGEPISITANGIQALNEKSLGALPISALNTLLKELGITIAVTNATDKVSGPSASRELDGLEISINLDTLDTAANKFASLLPAKLISELPVAIPNEQQITLYFGRVQVSSTASPNFVVQLGQHRRRRVVHVALDRRVGHRQHRQQRLHRQHGQRHRRQLRRQHRQCPRIDAREHRRHRLLAVVRVPPDLHRGGDLQGDRRRAHPARPAGRGGAGLPVQTRRRPHRGPRHHVFGRGPAHGALQRHARRID